MGQIVRPRADSTFERLWRDHFGGMITKSGKPVNASTALQVMVVYACLRVISEGYAQVPLKVFTKRPDGGRDEAPELPLFEVLNRRPNSWQSSFEFRETQIFHAGLTGNFFAFKNRVRNEIRELIPITPGLVTVKRQNYRLSYLVRSENNNEEREFPAETIWHFRGPSWNSWMGLEAVKIAREAIGLALATEEAHAKLHANGVQTSGVYSVEGTLTPEQYGKLYEWIKNKVATDNKFDPLILDRGAKYTSNTMTGVDSQHLETRKHQVEEVCRGFRVMPIMIGQADKAATYASAEQMFLAHVIHTLCPWYARGEQSMDINLLTPEERKAGYYTKFIPNGLMRGAAKDRSEFYWKLWQMAALNPNEIRAFEEMNPYDEGNTYRVPGNTIPADMEEQLEEVTA